MVFFGGVLFAETVAIIVLRASIRGTIPTKNKKCVCAAVPCSAQLTRPRTSAFSCPDGVVLVRLLR